MHPSIQAAIQAQDFETLKGQADRKFKNVRSRHLWSVYNFSRSATANSIDANGLKPGDYSVFSTTAGSNGQGLPQGEDLSEIDTNFPGAGRVGDDQNFAIWELGVSVLPARQSVVALDTTVMAEGPPSPLDVDQILSSGVLVLKYIDVELPLGPLSSFAQPGGPFIAAPTLLDYGQSAQAVAEGVAGGLAEGSTASPWDSRQAKLTTNGGNLPAAPGMRRKLQVPIFLPKTVNFTFAFRFARTIKLLTVGQGGTGAFKLRLDWWAVESFRDQS
jgi:hypothetical protein